MYRIDDPTASPTLPAPEAAGTAGYFTEGSPVAGIPATNVRGSWLNMIQEELSSVISAAAIAPSKTNYAQLLTALRSVGVFQTAAQFDVSTKVATMEALKRALGSYAGYSSIAAARTLVAADIGTVMRGAAAAPTLTLPTPASIGASLGDAFSVFGNTGGIVAVTPGPGVALNYDSSISSISIASGQSATFIAVGATTWQVVNSSAGIGAAIGNTQTWQNLTASRAVGTNYTNSTGRSIMVAVGMTTSVANATAVIIINGIQIGGSSNPNAGAPQSSVTAIVPAGATYSASMNIGTTSLTGWVELR